MNHPEGDDPTYDAARVELGRTARRLNHAIVARDVEIEQLLDATASMTRLAEEFERSDRRERSLTNFKNSKRVLFADGARMTSHICRPGSGPGSPHGLEMEVVRRGEVAEARFIIGDSYEGAPGRGHGGVVALAFDDTMGFVLNIIHTVAYTGEITVRYEAPAPLNRPLVIRARMDRRDGRKLHLVADLREDRPDAPLIATSHALFVAIESYDSTSDTL
ncbi:MAG: PaaI family thioesterase [Actinobacteria bacterium]|nr:PaaI family thioesterase [Actinomycetota bacterium]